MSNDEKQKRKRFTSNPEPNLPMRLERWETVKWDRSSIVNMLCIEGSIKLLLACLEQLDLITQQKTVWNETQLELIKTLAGTIWKSLEYNSKFRNGILPASNEFEQFLQKVDPELLQKRIQGVHEKFGDFMIQETFSQLSTINSSTNQSSTNQSEPKIKS